MAKSRRAPDEDARRRRPDDEDDDRPRKGRRPRDDEDEEEDDEDRGPEKPRKKRQSASGPVKLVLRIIGAVAAAVFLIVLLYWIYTPVGTDYKLLAYFPPETVSLTGYDVDEVSRIVKMKEVHDTLIGNYKTIFGEDRFTQDAGVTYTDVEKYLSGHAAGDPEEEKDLPPDSQDRRGNLTVVRFKKDVDQAKFIGSFTTKFLCEERTGRDGKTFYQLYQRVPVPPDWHLERRDDISFYFPKGNTLVYASTRRELMESMSRTPGKVVVTGDMRELADKVDGHYFSASTGPFGFGGFGGNSMAFGLGFVDEDIRDRTKTPVFVTGTASWIASNGNDFLYANGVLYSDAAGAREVRRRLRDAFEKAKIQAYQSEGGKVTGLTNPFEDPAKAAAKGGFGGGGGGNSDEAKAVFEALTEYTKSARVYNRGRLVVVEGTIPHGMPEQGTFEKFWGVIGSKFRYQKPGQGGMPGLPGMPGPGGGMPMPGPPRPPGM